MKILLTGATGFIGSHVARVLVQRNHEVNTIIRSESRLCRINDIKSKLQFHYADLLETPTINFCPDIAIHLAWYTEPGKYLSSKRNIDLLRASLKFVQDLTNVGCKRLVAVGTCFEYDMKIGLLNELSPTQPRHVYSACKLALFHTLQQYCLSVGMEFAWTRLFYQFGPFEHKNRLVPYIINSLLKGKPATLTPGNQVRDFLYVEDVASAIYAVMMSSLIGPVNIGSGTGVSVSDLAYMVGEIIGRNDLIKLGAKPHAADDPMRVIADCHLLCSNTGWRPSCDLKTGIHRTVEWWKTQI